jgi:uncharacterized protein (TIGR00255 family)
MARVHQTGNMTGYAMISSMTAFSRSEQHFDWGSASWEIRSVNHRYLEPTFKLPEELRGIETSLRDHLKQQLGRGKIDCTLKLARRGNGQSHFNIDPDTLSALLAACQTIGQQPGNWSPMTPLEVLAWPGLLDRASPCSEVLIDDVITQFDQALQELSTTRRREGTQLASMIAQRLDDIEAQLRDARIQLPTILHAQQQRLQQKLADLVADVDHQRLEQELVYAAQKADVEEELDRLDTHIKEVRRILHTGGSCGRRLDFLMQELNREANTLSSKSISATTTLIAVQLKVLIEQMREQIQNIE